MITNIFGLLMCLGFGACYVPQIIKIYKTKSVDDISIPQYWLTILGYSSATLYMFFTGFGWWWLLNYATGIGFCAWVIVLCHRFKKVT